MSSVSIRVGESIAIGDDVKIGANTVLIDTDSHSLDWRIRMTSEDRANAKNAPIVIEDGVLIGTGCIILKGVTIGEHTSCYWGVDFRLVKCAYTTYMKHIHQTKCMLQKEYDVNVILKTHPGLSAQSRKTLISRIHHVLNYKNVLRFMKQFVFVELPTRIYGDCGIIEI